MYLASTEVRSCHVKGHGGRGGAGGVSRGFQTVGEATGVADGGEGVGPGVVLEASLRQTDSGHGAGGRENGQGWPGGTPRGPGSGCRLASRWAGTQWLEPPTGGWEEGINRRRRSASEAASLFLQNVSNSKAVRKNRARRDADCSWIPFPGFPIC